MTSITVLGASGMLGSMVARVLASTPGWEVIAPTRAELDATDAGSRALDDLVERSDWVINAIGAIKQLINEDDPSSTEWAIAVNAVFPHRLARAAERSNTSVIQIATDCVYAGKAGGYVETDPHDPLDVYGKSKSLGEVRSDALVHLRCSIVGPEPQRAVSLLEWFLARSTGEHVPGYANHRWNGITTLHFARLCAAVIRGDAAPPALLHVVPADAVTKAELLNLFALSFDRADLTIEPVDAPDAVDRTLATGLERKNSELWAAAGYERPPTIAMMVEELAAEVGTSPV
jgi:dTDP-4-dehydrorhamnose reductase